VLSCAQAPLTIVFAEGLEPLCWEENGKPMGEQPEIAQYVLDKLGLRARFLFCLGLARKKWLRSVKPT
jgi:hypothetical protein